MLGKQLQTAAAGNAGGEVLGVEDVFSTYLYTGNGSTQTITNGIDLAGEGGLVWVKRRDGAQVHVLQDTERGTSKFLRTNTTGGQSEAGTARINAFNSDGFSVGGDADVNFSSQTYASWTFRKAEKFFDVVTYTGNGVSGRTISHGLGSVPGCIIVKRLDIAENWTVYHRSTGATQILRLDTTSAAFSSPAFDNTAPTSSVFSVNNYSEVNASGGTYVAYLFAHDAGGFGEDGTESVIKCGIVTANGSGNYPAVNLGWEPQFILCKRSVATNWELVDTMRGMPANDGTVNTARLFPNTSGAEDSTFPTWGPTSTGMSNGVGVNPNEQTIYIAIRRGPMKTPTDATKVFGIEKLTGSQSSPAFRTGVLTDMGWARRLSNGSYYGAGVGVFDRLRGDQGLATGSTAFEYGDSFVGDNMIGFYSSAISEDIGYSFRRAPGFFDVVAYTGDGVNNRSIPHNLAVTPELVIYKCRSNGATQWFITHSSFAADTYLWFTAGTPNVFSGTFGLPTSTNLVVGNAGGVVNDSGRTYIAYLFASAPGVSKVGSYTGTANTLNIDCGFTAGARFVLIKRTNSTGDWYVWDTARGIVSGNDPYLLLNSTAVENTGTDYIDPLSSGFQISSTAPAAINALGGSYIYLAIA